MHQIAHRIRYLLRWAGILAGGLIVAAAALAALLPFLVDAEAIRGTLSQSLSAWSGGPVSITGPLRIGSFADLSVEAAGVALKSMPEQGPIRIASAKSVTAVVRLSSLLRGKLEFRKFVIASPRVVFRRGFPESAQTSYGLGAARLALALSAGSPFADVELRDPVLFFTASANGAYERAELSRVRLSKNAVSSVSTGVFVKNAPGTEGALYALDVTSRGFEVSFRGQCAGACQTAFGSLRLRAAALGAGAGEKILAAMAPWERPATIALSGELTLSRRRAALDNAAISFGDHAAKGSLALDLTGVQPRLEGTIAYDTLDVTPAWIAASGSFAENPPLAALPLARRGTDRPLDFDLRVSADRFRAASFKTGPLALALTQIQDRLSVDIASVAVFGGHATGRLDINPGQPASLSLRTSGSQLDAKALASAFKLPLGFGGPVSLQAALTMPVTMRQPDEDVSAATGTFSIRFPTGGSFEGDVAQTLGSALLEQDLGWGLRGSSIPFSVASIDGMVKPGILDLKVQGQSGEKGIGGSLRIGFPGAAVSGTLLASEALDTGAREAASPPAEAASSTKLVLSGTADALILSSVGKPSLSN